MKPDRMFTCKKHGIQPMNGMTRIEKHVGQLADELRVARGQVV
ncbi:hypothetical protein ACLMAB_19670 [Brevibacillus laterosporus]